MPNLALSPTGYGRIKPGPGVCIDWSHPLAKGLAGCWLFNEGGGKSNIHDIAAWQTVNTTTGTPAWSPSGSPWRGAAINTSTGGNYWKINRKKGPANSTDKWTCAALVYATNATGCIINYGEVTDSNFTWSMGIANTNNLTWGYDGFITQNISLGLSVSLNAWHAVAISTTSSTSRLGMVDGKFATNTTAPSGPTTSAGGLSIAASFANSTHEAADWQGKLAAIFSWNYNLSQGKLSLWNANPFAMIRQVAPRRAFGVAAAASAGFSYFNGLESFPVSADQRLIPVAI